jgi:hypothetical protein
MELRCATRDIFLFMHLEQGYESSLLKRPALLRHGNSRGPITLMLHDIADINCRSEGCVDLSFDLRLFTACFGASSHCLLSDFLVGSTYD